MPKHFAYVAAAYAAIWVVLIVYLMFLGSRLTKIERQINLFKTKKK